MGALPFHLPGPSLAATLLLALAASPATYSGEAGSLALVPKLALPQLDEAALLAEDEAAPPGTPTRVAAAIDVSHGLDDGAWDTLDDGTRLWRLRVESPGATDLALGFRGVALPAGSTLVLADESGTHAVTLGPRDVHEAELWTPVVPGDRALLELRVPPATREPLALELVRVQHGYRDLFDLRARPKSGTCNVDVACSTADPWRDLVRSVAMYTVQLGAGTASCTGTLVMDEPGDFTPYVLTANHCGVTTANDQTVVVYWNYETTGCGGARNGSLADSQTGAILRASHPGPDFALLELSQPPDPAFGVHHAGWDRSGLSVLGAVSLHHPSGDEKAISLDQDLLTTTDNCIDTGYRSTHWRVGDWETGTTEQGSSGGPLFDDGRRQVVGVLSGGTAACDNLSGSDCFGKLSVAWVAGSTASGRLRDWLDPAGTNATSVAGSDPPVRVELVSLGGTDACATGGAGGDGAWDPGETVTVPVTIRASGALTSVSGTLQSLVAGVTVEDGTATWPNLAAGADTVTRSPHFRVRLDRSLACGASLPLRVTVQASGLDPQVFDVAARVGRAAVSDAPRSIPDGGSVSSLLVVPAGAALSDLDVDVTIDHTYVGDLRITLQSPQGTTLTLLDRPGVPASNFGCGDDDLHVVFDDEAATSASSLEARCAGASPWFDGRARPAQALSAFDGQSPVGTWTLRVSDAATPDAGSVTAWSLAPAPAFSATCTTCPVPCGDPNDFDADGVGDSCDLCRLYADPAQSDADGDGVGDACEFEWGDLAPVGAPDGRVTVGDVVKALRFTVGLDATSADDLKRGNVAPASIAPGPPEIATPTLAAPRVLDVTDVVLLQRAAVGLTAFAAPR